MLVSRPGRTPHDRTTSGRAQRQGSRVPARRGQTPRERPGHRVRKLPGPKGGPPAPYQMEAAKGANPTTNTRTPSTRRRGGCAQASEASRRPAPLLPNRRVHIHHHQQQKNARRATQCTRGQPPTPGCRRRNDASKAAVRDHHARHKPSGAPPQAPKITGTEQSSELPPRRPLAQRRQRLPPACRPAVTPPSSSLRWQSHKRATTGKRKDEGNIRARAAATPAPKSAKRPPALPATAPHAACTSGPEGTTGRQKDAKRGGPPQQPATRGPVAPPGSYDAGNQEGLEEALREAAAHPASEFGAKESPEEARGAQVRHLGERRRRASGRPRAHEGVPGPRQKLV